MSLPDDGAACPAQADLDLDLDQALVQVFDEPPSSPATACVPPSPERVSAPPASPKRTILSVLAEKKDTLTGTAAEIAAEVAAAKALTKSIPPSRPAIHEAMMIRRASKRAPSEADELRAGEKRRRKARNAFKVVGKEKKDVKHTFDYLDERFCNMSLREARLPQEAMTALFENCTRVDISEITKKDDEMRAGKLGEYVVFGCLVKKHSKKETKTGNKYAVWSLCNMPRKPLTGSESSDVPKPTVVTLLLFEEAFQAFHTTVEGTVFALRKPQLLPPRGSDSSRNDVRGGNAEYSGHCLKVSKTDFVITIGICKDFQLCETEGPNLSVCGDWYDANRMSRCPYHMQRKRKKQLNGTRMDVNNAERPGISSEAMKHLQAPYNISTYDGSREGRNGEDRQEVSEDLKYQRREERKKIQKLVAAKKELPPSLTGDERRNLLRNRKNRTGYVHKRQLSQPVFPQGLSGQRSGTKVKVVNVNKTLQTHYHEAIEVLVRCGFILGDDGSLCPPIGGLLKVKLRTSRDESRGSRQQPASSSATPTQGEKPSAYVQAHASRGSHSASPTEILRAMKATSAVNPADKLAAKVRTAGIRQNGIDACKRVTASPPVRKAETSDGKECNVGHGHGVALDEAHNTSPFRHRHAVNSLSAPKFNGAQSDHGIGKEGGVPALGLTTASSEVAIELEEESEDE